ncbi:Crp/Fnr family transcriptional regulator [Sphingomonas hankookensis]|uniref:Crp/Fnr family transcriptional regulator n=1 Tax=Sphingomonas hankookensis TaxID=563996 RepID=UPI001F58679F|nr:cyclic nucleotide-binding domain-containing protein [Sphingomonas hankookensis]
MTVVPHQTDGAMPTSPIGDGNRLLATLEPGDLALLAPALERVSLEVGDTLLTAGGPIEHVYFLEGGIAAVLEVIDGERLHAVGLLGSDGYVGWPVLLGDDRSPHDVVLRAEPGTALRIPVDRLMAALDQSESLQAALLRFVQVFLIQMGRTVVSALSHPVERRLARWILLYHDRVRGDEISMTHEEFRLMLAVRRSSITDALHKLEETLAIRALRGRVIVRDREKLLEMAAMTYGPAEEAYVRLVGSPAA